MRHVSLLVATALMAATIPAARASIVNVPQISSNYTFPGGQHGFSLEGFLPAVQNVPFNPGVLVGFNPQPDPPGFPTALSLLDPTHPVLFNGAPESDFQFLVSLLIPPGPCDSGIPAPNSDGVTNFHCMATIGDTTYNMDLAMQFSGPGGVASWVSFNPQPDPPGDVAGDNLAFSGLDAAVSFSLSVNGQDASFRLVPEPATLGVLGVGLGALIALRRRRRI